MSDRTGRRRDAAGRAHRGRRPTVPGLGYALAFGIALLVATVAAAPGGLATGQDSSARPPGGWTAATVRGSTSWNNSAVQLDLRGPGPAFALASLADGRVRTSFALVGIAEITPARSFAASAAFAGPNATWVVTSSEGGGAVHLQLSGTVPVTVAQGSWDSENESEDSGEYGNASVVVSVDLNGSPSLANAVRVSVAVASWPWVDATNDSLGLEMSMAAASATRIVPWVGTSPSAVQEATNVSGATVATLNWSQTATVCCPGGSAASVGVSAYAAGPQGGGANASVRLLFGTFAQSYRNVSYDPWIALNPNAFAAPSLPPWAISGFGWAVLAAATIVCAVLAVVALRRKPAPPDDL